MSADRVTYFMEIIYADDSTKAFQFGPSIPTEFDDTNTQQMIDDWKTAVQQDMGEVLTVEQAARPDAEFSKWWSQNDAGEQLDTSTEPVLIV